MSGGGGVPKPPDLTQQTDQANQTFKTATSNAAQTMEAATANNKKAQGTLDSVVGSQLDSMGQLNKNAETNLNTYGNTFVDLQKQQADQAKEYTSEENMKLAQGRATADANAANSAALNNARQRLAASGVDPNSIQGRALDQQARIEAAKQTAQMANQAVVQRQEQGSQLVANANQLGLQINAAGQQGAANGANLGSQAVANTNQTNATGIQGLGASNSYLQSATGANQSAADITNSGFQNEMAAANLKQQQSAAKMSAITSLAGGAMAMMAEGGVVPETHGIPPPGVEPNFMMEHGGPVSEHGALPTPPIPGSTDRKITMLTPGEFVVPKDIASWKGHEYFYKEMDKIRQKKGEMTGALPSPSTVHTVKGV